jgi:uncharacterized protein YecE (DUF72 family)
MKERDFLSFYCRFFNALEINFTFYRMPAEHQIGALADRVDTDMAFSVKVFQGFTHGGNSASELKFFIKALSPMIQRNMLKCLLFQFPFSFKKTDENLTRIEQLSRELGFIPGVIEFRHLSWVEPETMEYLSRLNLGFCCVDQPNLPNLTGPDAYVTAPLAYVRFHGRNAQKWWEHEHGWERYDYTYTEQELGLWIPKIRKIRAQSDVTMVFFNNHYRGQAVQNAQLFAAFME